MIETSNSDSFYAEFNKNWISIFIEPHSNLVVIDCNWQLSESGIWDIVSFLNPPTNEWGTPQFKTRRSAQSFFLEIKEAIIEKYDLI